MFAAISYHSCYYWFLPFVVFFGNCMYIGFSNHQIYIFLNFVSLLVLVALVFLVLRVLCLSLIFLLIYSGAVIITFIFVLMTFDQSDIHCIPSYNEFLNTTDSEQYLYCFVCLLGDKLASDKRSSQK